MERKMMLGLKQRAESSANQALPFSAQLRTMLKTFLAHNLRARE